LKILAEEIPAITWLVGAIAQDDKKTVYKRTNNGQMAVIEVKEDTFKGVSKDIALTLLKLHFATIKKDRGLYTVTIVKSGTQFLSNLMMLMGLNPRPEGKPVDEHIIELAEQIEE
jgi:hypothetical protein